MTTYKVTIKEKNNPHEIVTEYVGNVDEQYVIKFFGLTEPDVEWYNIEKE